MDVLKYPQLIKVSALLNNVSKSINLYLLVSDELKRPDGHLIVALL